MKGSVTFWMTRYVLLLKDQGTEILCQSNRQNNPAIYYSHPACLPSPLPALGRFDPLRETRPLSLSCSSWVESTDKKLTSHLKIISCTHL